MAIEILEFPRGTGADLGGPLALPQGFDTKAHAAGWFKEGPSAEAATQRQFLTGTQRVTADGYVVWKDSPGDPTKGKPYKVTLQSGVYVLMYRPRDIQNAVNAIFGNVGKEMLAQERRGETLGGIPVQPGMLNEERLAKTIGREALSDEEGDVKMNPVPNVYDSRVEKSVVEVG